MATPTFIAPSSPLDRRRLGKYEVLCRLSTGGMSEIYLAHQTGLAGFNKLVVLKTILPDIGGEEDFVRMFLDEARITAAFNHPNVAQVYELDTADGQLFMAMEFVQGCTLVEMARACRAAKEPIPIGFTLASVRDTALALHYAHTYVDARGRRQIVIHRDVAEKNIMVTYEGVTKLLDFGIAKSLGRSGRTNVGMVKGTSGYMSPEQIRGEPLDGRSDVFSLGVVAHECLTGLRLFHGKSAQEGMMAALRDEVAPPSKWNPRVPPAIDEVVLKALQRDRDARFNTALEFAREIERVGQGAIWHPEQSGEVVSRFFAERRAETRRLLESSVGGDFTSEIRVKSIMQKVRNSAQPAEAERPRASPPVVAAPPPPGQTLESVLPAPITTPGRPGPARAEVATLRASSLPSPSPSPRLGPPVEDFDDDSDAKTIPAAALPDEIQALRKRLAEAAQARKAQAVTISDRGGPAPAPAEGTATAGASLAPSPVAPPPPAQSGHDSDAETLSITRRDPHTSDWDDDDEDAGALTAVARPGEVLGVIGRRDEEDLRATYDLDEASLAAVRSPVRSYLLLAALVVLSLFVVAGLLVLFDVIPPGGSAPTGAPQTERPARLMPQPPAE